MVHEDPLAIEFQRLFLRSPASGEKDIELWHQALKDLGTLVCQVQGFLPVKSQGFDESRSAV